MHIYYSTGEFANLAQVTIRTVRYYDKIGLLKPSFVMENKYRRYSENDFLKLQKIISLKHLGFSLEEIYPLIVNDNENNLEDSLDMQIQLVIKKIKHLSSLKNALKSTKKLLSEGKDDWSHIVDLIRISNQEEQIVEQYMNSNNLNVRINLHEQFSSNEEGWFNWVYKQIDFTKMNRLLELGCGNGKLWENSKINLRNRELFLSDISEGMLEEAKKNLGDIYNYLVIDCENVPFKKEYFDMVIANHVLFHVRNISLGIKEINRILKQDGILYCSAYGESHMREINELVYEFDSSIKLSNDHLYELFGLDNGEELLSPYFNSIEKRVYKDSLFIDDIQFLMDYILSCQGNQNEFLVNKYNDLKSFLTLKMKEKGYIKVSKNAGLFICCGKK